MNGLETEKSDSEVARSVRAEQNVGCAAAPLWQLRRDAGLPK